MDAIWSSETLQRYKPEDRTIGETKLRARDYTSARLKGKEYNTTKSKMVMHPVLMNDVPQEKNRKLSYLF